MKMGKEKENEISFIGIFNFNKYIQYDNNF